MKEHRQKLYRSFQNQLRQTLAFAKEEQLTFQELYVVLYEAKIQLQDAQEAEKLKKHFDQGNIPIREVYKLFTPIKYQIVHNVPTLYKFIQHSVVKIAKDDLGHRPEQCFEWWKVFMEKKYGNQLRWFDSIALDSNCRRMKSFAFKENLKIVLGSTEHRYCAENICSKFPKNTKNQIEWSTFMAVIRLNPKKYQSKKMRSKSQTAERVNQRAKTEYNPEKTVGVWSQCSFEKPLLSSTSRTRCQTPNTIKMSSIKKMKTYKSVKENKSCLGNLKIRFAPFRTRYLEEGKKFRLSTEVVQNCEFFL